MVFRKFFGVSHFLGSFRTCSDEFGHVRMRSMRSDVIGHVLKISDFFDTDISERFRMFSDVLGRFQICLEAF